MLRVSATEASARQQQQGERQTEIHTANSLPVLKASRMHAVGSSVPLASSTPFAVAHVCAQRAADIISILTAQVKDVPLSVREPFFGAISGQMKTIVPGSEDVTYVGVSRRVAQSRLGGLFAGCEHQRRAHRLPPKSDQIDCTRLQPSIAKPPAIKPPANEFSLRIS